MAGGFVDLDPMWYTPRDGGRPPRPGSGRRRVFALPGERPGSQRRLRVQAWAMLALDRLVVPDGAGRPARAPGLTGFHALPRASPCP
jgi:hypothetical protein